MNRAAFWTIIDDARTVAENDEAFMGRLVARLRTLTLQELTQFQRHFDEVLAGSYTLELWGAIYIVTDGCGDDAFEYFRAWLIAQGRQTFERVTAAPDTLVELDRVSELLDMLGIAADLYEEKTGGKTMPRAQISYSDLGDGWDFDDEEEMKRRYPRLTADCW